MTPSAQAIRNQEILKTEYSEKAAIGALYDELSKGILLCRGGFHHYGNLDLKRPHVLAIHYKENAENQQINLLQSSANHKSRRL